MKRHIKCCAKEEQDRLSTANLLEVGDDCVDYYDQTESNDGVGAWSQDACSYRIDICTKGKLSRKIISYQRRECAENKCDVISQSQHYNDPERFIEQYRSDRLRRFTCHTHIPTHLGTWVVLKSCEEEPLDFTMPPIRGKNNTATGDYLEQQYALISEKRDTFSKHKQTDECKKLSSACVQDDEMLCFTCHAMLRSFQNCGDKELSYYEPIGTVYSPINNMGIKLLTVQQTHTSLDALWRNQRLRSSAVIRRHPRANKSATLGDISLSTFKNNVVWCNGYREASSMQAAALPDVPSSSSKKGNNKANPFRVTGLRRLPPSQNGTRLGHSFPESSPPRGRSITPSTQLSSTTPLPPSHPWKSSSTCYLTPPQLAPTKPLVVQQRKKRWCPLQDGALPTLSITTRGQQ
eukprot:XP_014071351.1 PREDICTED: uncharacterized protein LOC106613527 isoform X1 [Salmo salar]